MKLSGLQKMFPDYFNEGGAFNLNQFKTDMGGGGFNLFDLFSSFNKDPEKE